MFPKIDSHSNIPAKVQNFQKIKECQKFSKNFKMIKFSKSLKKITVLKFKNFNIWIIILKNDKTIIAYFFSVLKRIIKQLYLLISVNTRF